MFFRQTLHVTVRPARQSWESKPRSRWREARRPVVEGGARRPVERGAAGEDRERESRVFFFFLLSRVDSFLGDTSTRRPSKIYI